MTFTITTAKIIRPSDVYKISGTGREIFRPPKQAIQELLKREKLRIVAFRPPARGDRFIGATTGNYTILCESSTTFAEDARFIVEPDPAQDWWE